MALLCSSYALSTEEIFKKTRGAVVEIVTQDKNGSVLGTGTGFFISNDGELITNRHVVEGAASIIAKSAQGSFFVCQGILAEPKTADLAVLKFEAHDVPVLELATASQAIPGQKVVVIGNPLGLEGTVSEGIVSAVRNDLGLIQISAPISPGSSGSPVMTEDGRVIAVATLQSKIGQSLNFAIPVETVQAALAGIDQHKVDPLAAGPPRTKSAQGEASELSHAKELLDSDIPAALSILREYLAKHPEDSEAWATRAQGCYFHGLMQEAVESAQKAVDLDPANLNNWRILMQCLAVFATGSTDPTLATRLREVAEHDLAMGDDYQVAWEVLIQASKVLGDTQKAAEFQERYAQLQKTGEIAFYDFNGHLMFRNFDGNLMEDLAQFAKRRELELHEDGEMLNLTGSAHSFIIAKDGSGMSIDGLYLQHDVKPRKYKDGRYFIDADL